MYSLKSICDHKNLGQAMIEVVVAFALIIFFLSGIVLVELYSVRNIDYSNKKSLATSLARQQIERVRVVRDSSGIDNLSSCQLNPCYINANLTPEAVLPTGFYQQSFSIAVAASGECTLPQVTITPAPVVYKVTSQVTWSSGSQVTPGPMVNINSCLTDWR